jgi:undecaprenyl-diphosphatase
MSWIETIDAWDRHLMLTLNLEGNEVTDCFWAIYSGKWIWLAPVLLIAYTLICRCRGGWRPALVVVAFTALLIYATDQVSASVIKPLICRPRPSHTEGLAQLLHYVGSYRGGHFGFVSSHAANSMGFAFWLSLLFHGRILRSTIFLWAILNCFSRIQLGVHFPGDLLAGGLLGMLIAYGFWWTYVGVCRLVFGMSLQTLRQEYEREPWMIIVAVWGAMLILLLIALFFTEMNPLVK